MPRLRLPAALTVLAALAACQAPPTPPTTPASIAPSTSPSAGPSTDASSPVVSSPSAPAVQNRVLLTGHIYDDKGAALDGAKVEVWSNERPEINQTIEAFGGAYSVMNVPAGTLVRLRASKAGYTVREQWVKAEAVSYGADSNPNIRDFGGEGKGMLLALSEFPEITMTEPANKANNVSINPLTVKFHLSHPFSERDRLQFESLLQVVVPGPSGDILLTKNSSYRDQKATVTWDETGTIGTFNFAAPLVTFGATTGTVTVKFDQTVPLANWPEDKAGRVLGQGVADETAEGSGALVRRQIAPFLRTEFPTPPSTRPEQLEVWGLAHATTIGFNLVADGRRPKVTSVRGVRGVNGNVDRILVTFDKPMRGYPESAAGVVNYHPSVLKGSNYHFFLGSTEKSDDRERFEAGDPKTQGTTPDSPEFGSSSDTIVVLPLSAGTLSKSSVLKVYVDEAVSDIAGNPIQTSPQDPVTHLADHVVQGVIQ